MSEAMPDDLWTPYKYLFKVVNSFLTTKNGETSISNLDYILRKHKQNFINLLKNPPKNSKSREEIRSGISDGVNLPGLGHTVLSKDLVDETIIISDMYNLNEYIALELVCTAQQQMPFHPGLPRGLVAVLLYYDGRKTLVTILKMLFQARHGISWCTEIPQEVTKCVTNFTDSLALDGILNKMVDCLENLDISKELDILTANRALGPPKHHRQILDLFEEIRFAIASALFNWSAQCGLPKDVSVKLIKFLSKYKSTTERGGIEDVVLTLEMCLLYAVDLSVIQRREDGEEIVKKIPMICETGFTEVVIDALATPWECEGLQALIKFAMGISIATLRLVPNLCISSIDQDEQLVDDAIEKNVFDFIHYTLLENESIFTTEFFFRKIHVLLTDFIELMHSKVTELRARADETAKIVQCYSEQGIDPPANLCHNFESLLLAVGKLYENDKLNLCLGLEYWGPMEIAGNYPRTSSRSVSLFKFIRLAGELLPPILFIPYLKMLAGLSSCQQSARNAFNLLKQGSGGSGSSTLSWDHFFSSLSRYYVNLRQEQNPNTDTVYRNRALNRNISPQEIAGLQAVLNVVRAVSTHDEVARIALCEHPTWTPLNVMIGLVTCSCAIHLKVDLLLTLSALGKSKETALQLWNILESSQIITTIPSTTTVGTRGLESELEHIESRNETYPLTQAMLHMLYTLVSTAVPNNLGAGPRIPGLDPYLTFIVDSVFSKVLNRTYKDPSEKWIVAEKCLKLIDFFTKTYDPNPNDFPPTKQLQKENSPPGFHIMLQMNTKSELFRLILYIINEGNILIESYAPFSGKSSLESCILYALNIIEICLSQQETFFNAHFTGNCTILLTGINKLLLGINPRSGQADHMLNITKYICYNSWMIKHSLLAVRILRYVARQPNVNTHLLSIFTSQEKLKNEIRHGFVECLENNLTSIENIELEEIEINVELATKESILNLLHECLPQPAPNIAHYLLGFDLSKDVKSTRFQQPGVMNFPTTCIKSLITMLDNSLESMKNGESPNEVGYEKLVGNGYSLLYALCLNSRTSEPVLRFLRSCNDFLYRHISALPFKNANNPRILNHMTGLLKCVAIELKMSAANNQITQFANLCKVLLGVGQSSYLEKLAGNNSSLFNLNSINSDINMTNRKPTEHGTRILICQLLDCMDFEIKPLGMPKWDFFENSLMHGLFQNCEIQSHTNGPKLIDIVKLHDVLRDELNTVQSTMAAGQRQSILNEIQAILKYALQLNNQKSACRSAVKFLEAWGQLTEILFSVAPPSAIAIDVKQGLIIEILQALLNKIVPVQTMPELANLSSSTVLLLLVNLRHCYRFQSSSDTENLSQSIINITNSTVSSNNKINQLHSNVNSLSLKYILKNIIEWIIVSGVASQKLRINLYASLLNYMHIIKRNDNKNNGIISDEFYVSRLDRTRTHVFVNDDDDDAVNQAEQAIEVFASFGDKLFDILCHDCTGGHDVCKMLAFSCIDMLLDIDSMANFIYFISKRGYLSHLIDSLMKSDDELSHILESTPDNLKALYVYESKMAMLSRVASTHSGAELLLEQKLLGVLSGMRVYDLHPDFQLNNYPSTYNSFVPPVEVRYRQILFPALNLCDVILSTLGSENHSAISQIIHLLLSHGEMIEIILRAGTPFLSLGLLQELSAVTGLIARSTNQEINSTFSPLFNLDIGAHLYRLQKLMLTLMPRFILSETTLKEMFQRENLTYEPSDKNKSQHIKLVLQIACNLAMYSRNSIANYAADHRTINILFSPNINDATHTDSYINALKSSPNLGLIISQLKSCVQFYIKERNIYDNLSRTRNSLPNLSLDTTIKQQYENLSEKLKDKQETLKLSTFLIEQCLYLLWTHIDFYMKRAVPVNHLQYSNYNDFNQNSSSLITSAEAIWKVTSDDVSTLKKAIANLLNDLFCKQICLASQESSGSEDGFLDALIRRIKCLVQFVPGK